MDALVAYPVRVLEDHITGLEAAISLCLAEPDHKPVHKLRTETRRIAALVSLVDLVPEMPEHRKEAAALLRRLRKLRRAAASVRDLDVHRKMLEAFGAVENEAAQQNGAETRPWAAAKVKATAGLPAPPPAARDDAAELSKAAAELRDSMGRSREEAAGQLQQVLARQQRKTTGAAQELLRVLHPARDFELAGHDLLRDAEATFTRNRLLAPDRVEDLSADELHTVRKAAKRARYLAEALPQDAALVAAAQRFEELQEAGGQWHDALEITAAARQHFGKHHELTVVYRAQRDRELAHYRALLLTTTQAAQPAREPRKGVRRRAVRTVETSR